MAPLTQEIVKERFSLEIQSAEKNTKVFVRRIERKSVAMWEQGLAVEGLLQGFRL